MLALLQELVRTNSVNPSLESGGPGEGSVAAIVEREFAGGRFVVRRLEATPGRPSVVVRKTLRAVASIPSYGWERTWYPVIPCWLR